MSLWNDILFFGIPLEKIIYIIIIVAAALILERLITRQLRKFAARRELPPDVGNGLVLTFRFLILVGAVAMLLRVGGVSSDIITAFSALGGAAVGFASTRTIGNFIAGLFLLASRPFRVRDYVRLGDVEGIVDEITINYTKILTPGMTTVSISNQKILDYNIVNFRYMGTHPLLHEGEERALYCYSFEVSFDHTLPTRKLESVFDEVIERYAEKLPRKPEYKMTKLTRLDRIYMFYLYVESPEDIFTLQPTFLRELTERWEKTQKE
jgi:small-conductance mechanosensitive channel